MKLFTLVVNTPAGIFFEEEVLQVELKTPNGMIGILANHQPIIGSIEPSKGFIKTKDGPRVPVLINSGIFKTDGKKLYIITDFFYFADKLNQSVLEVRKQKIYAAIKSINLDDVKMQESISQKLHKEITNLTQLTEK